MNLEMPWAQLWDADLFGRQRGSRGEVRELRDAHRDRVDVEQSTGDRHAAVAHLNHVEAVVDVLQAVETAVEREGVGLGLKPGGCGRNIGESCIVSQLTLLAAFSVAACDESLALTAPLAVGGVLGRGL